MPVSPIRSDASRAARVNARLILAVLALALVPVPAIAAIMRGGLAEQQLGDVIAVLPALLHATPLFALPPFILGGGIGGLAYFVTSAPARFSAIEQGGSASIDSRALVASSLAGAGLFASIGLVIALTVFRVG